MTPRLLSRDAAAYCGVTAQHFEDTIGKEVSPIELGRRRLWDVKALDRWLDVRSGLVQPVQSNEDWLKRLGEQHNDRPRARDKKGNSKRSPPLLSPQER
jgi:hypothetical protein